MFKLILIVSVFSGTYSGDVSSNTLELSNKYSTIEQCMDSADKLTFETADGKGTYKTIAKSSGATVLLTRSQAICIEEPALKVTPTE